MIAVSKLRATELTGSKEAGWGYNKYTPELNVKIPKYCTHDVHELIVHLGLYSKDREW